MLGLLAILFRRRNMLELDLTQLQGIWTLASGVCDGRPLTSDARGGSFVQKLTITGDTVHWLRHDWYVEGGVLKLGPDADPKALDITFNGLKYLRWNGIYRLDGDRLTVCLRLNYSTKHDRPSKFSGE